MVVFTDMNSPDTNVKFGIVVDGYSTGSGLAEAFSKYGIRCVHVQSCPRIPPVYLHTFRSSSYFANHVFLGETDSLVATLKKYHPIFIIPGAECGVQFADSLAKELDLPANDYALSMARRNKYLMLEAVKAKGIQTIPTFQAKSVQDAVSWSKVQNVWPLVIKPINSAGGEGVKICYSVDDVKDAFINIMSFKTNMLGFKNEAVIVQHYIQGEEYVVNTVSYAGEHKFCELWCYERLARSTGQQIYDCAKIVDFDPMIHGDVVNYAMKVIDALGIKYGPAHVEIIKNDKGCFLVELGARLMGANLPFSFLEKCITTPQATLTVNAFANKDVFNQKKVSDYKITQPLMAVFMVSNQKGVITKIRSLEKVRSLESFYDMKLAVKEGDRLSNTIDYQTSPGMIYLSHQNPSMLEKDRLEIRELEKGMFQLN